MQPDGYRHDYTAIERHLRQLEAPADRQRLVGRSVLILAITAAACALLFTAAHAWRLVREPRTVETIVERIVPAAAPVSMPGLPDLPDGVDPDPGVVTTDFSLFRKAEVALDERTYVVTAGHRYLTETDTVFDEAWCYTRTTVDGVDISVSLGDLEPGAAPVPYGVSPQTLEKTGLTGTDHATLFRSCPWLTGNPYVEETEAVAVDVRKT